MANGQNIDQRLKAYAEQRKRQAGEPFAMSPVTRRFLQVEVERHWGAAAQQRLRQRWWEAWMPHLGWATATVGLALICLLAVWQSGREEKKPAELAGPNALSHPLVAPATAPQVATQPSVSNHAPAFTSVSLTATEPSRSKSLSSASLTTTQASAPRVSLQPALAHSADSTVSERSATKSGNSLTSQLVASAKSPPSAVTHPGSSLRMLPVHYGAGSESGKRLGSGPTSVSDEARSTPPSPAISVTRAHPPPRPAPSPVAPRSPLSSVAVATQALGAGMLQSGSKQPGQFASMTTVPTNEKAVAVRAQERPARVREVAHSSLPAPAPSMHRVLGFQQQFVQTWPGRPLRRNFNSPPIPNVLQSFRIEQVGGALRIADQDGSVYAVRLGQASPVAEGVEGPFLHSIALLLGGSQPAGKNATPSATNRAGARIGEPAAIFLNATGTNKTLNERVTFNGELVFTNTAQVRPPSARRAVTNSAALQVWLSNSVLAGEAQVGQGTRVVIEARPQQP